MEHGLVLGRRLRCRPRPPWPQGGHCVARGARDFATSRLAARSGVPVAMSGPPSTRAASTLNAKGYASSGVARSRAGDVPANGRRTPQCGHRDSGGVPARSPLRTLGRALIPVGPSALSPGTTAVPRDGSSRRLPVQG